MENIKEKIDEIVNKVKNDGDFANKFQNNPTKAVEEVIGIDLPDEQINGIIAGVKAKNNINNASDVVNKFKGIFGK